ncbi:Acetylornithine deacetylase [Agromyces sp. NDB4Y10]|uniref:M20/M25/M40 family metallo-hydrolase n=1 Tax=Agromyces sp. NDB4Y10 TaxID=1775951 RepID=UPI0007B2D560|nr:M20/M25/M40 family metallo-hydrolase [Agromyces sp. NDB4Y10]KZE92814.1 Acetylornithine deacetylase [Agromyces sp. NDB4Y10]
MIRTDDVVELTRALVAIDAVNPALVDGGAGEREIAEAIGHWLGGRGFDVRLVGADPARPSVLARRRGAGGGRTLLLAGHLDTVGGAGDGGRRADAAPDGDRVVGRGAYDMAGGLAAAMVAAAGADVAGDVVLGFAADEEFGSAGMEELLAELDAARPDGAVVLEPTDLDVTLAHRGFAWYRVEYEGSAAHGSQPELGVDAIDRALDGMVALRGFGAELAARPRHPLLGTGSVRVATIEGGTDAATVADRCVLVVERRTLPGEPDPAAELASMLAPSRPARIVPLVARPAMEADPGAPIARVVLDAVERATGAPAVRRGDPWWTDAGLIAERGVPVVLVGPAGGGAHADEEWVATDSLRTLVAVLRTVIDGFCAPR